MTAEQSRRQKRFHETVTVQGLTQISDSESSIFRRSIWLLIFCGGLGFTSFNIYNQITLYLSTPINVRVDQVLGNELPFPSVTICNNNYMRKSFMASYGLDNVVALFYPYRDFDENFTQDVSQLDFSSISLLMKDPLGALLLSTHSVENTTLKCDWESRPCGQDQFSHKSTDMGFCFSFNLNGTKFARNSGRAHGLRLVLNVHEEEYVRSVDGYLGTGFMIAVHAPEVPPIMSEMGIAVAPGFQHFMGVAVKVQTAKEGVSGCGSKTLEHTESNYSREACRLECRGNYLTKICKCKDFAIPNNVSICTPQEYSTCLIPTLEKYLQEGTGCEAECSEPCSYTSFSTQHSSSPLSRDYITEYTKAKGQTEDYWRKNLVILEVYLSSMAFEHMEKQLGYEILDLFCDIGGAMGLLLGASILTILEVLDYICFKFLSKMFATKKVQRIDVKPVN